MDLTRHLPLSTRPSDDESRVTSDERAAVAAAVDAVAAIVAERPDAADLTHQFVEEAGLADLSPAQTLAEAIRTGPRRRAKDLARAIRAQLLLADRLDVVASIDTATLGRVALHASTTAPFDRRAAIAGNTVRASDADWQFGRGPVIEASALDIVRFLLGISNEPPRRQAPAVSAPTTPETTI